MWKPLITHIDTLLLNFEKYNFAIGQSIALKGTKLICDIDLEPGKVIKNVA